MLLATNVDKKPMVPTIAVAVNNMFNNPADAFFSGRVMDLLYDGVAIDCSSDEMTTVAICTTFADNKGLRKVNDTHYAFSLFAGVSKPSNEQLL